jgi:hypothetical protein
MKTSMYRRTFKDIATTGTTAYTGAAVNADGMRTVSFQFSWTGTMVGAFSFEVSNDSTDGTDGTWTTLSSTMIGGLANIQPAGVATSSEITLECATRWIRPVYTNASSTGTLQGHAFGKAV